MKTKVVKKIDTEVISDVTCDLCGKSTRILDEDFASYPFSHGSLTFVGGYGSGHDMTRIELDLCESCLFEIVNRRISGHYVQIV